MQAPPTGVAAPQSDSSAHPSSHLPGDRQRGSDTRQADREASLTPDDQTTRSSISRTDEEIMRMLYASLNQATIAVFVGSGMLAYLLSGAISSAELLLWMGFMLAVATYRLVSKAMFTRRAPRGEEIRPWRRRFVICAALVGAGWGIAGYAFLQPGLPTGQTLVTLTIVGYMAGALTSLAILPAAFLVMYLPGIIPLIIRTLELGGAINLGIAFMLVVFTSFLLGAARRLHQKMLSALRLRFENEDLVALLREKNETAERLNRSLSEEVEERRRGTLQLIQAREQAEAANRAKSEFLANMSHEIRTPMNAIIGMTDLVLQSELDARQRDFVGIVKNSAEALLTIINDILDFSRIEAGKLSIEYVDCDLRRLLMETVRPLELRARAKDLALSCEVGADVPAACSCDPVRLRQILINLIGNAVKFCERGEIVVSLQWLDPADDGQTLQCTVRDTGIGIADDRLQRIFEPFVQADNSTTRAHGGTGLGLAITTQLVQLMEGHIWAESRLGQGSAFHFSLPLAASSAPPAAAPPSGGTAPHSCGDPAAAVAQPAPGERPTVLLVEDNATNQILAQVLLEHGGYEVAIAGNGQEALDAFTRQAFAAVLMDMQMPVMDGLEATGAIRALEATEGRPPTPIIAMTANALRGDRERCIEAGMDDYIAKPIFAEQLYETLARWTGR